MSKENLFFKSISTYPDQEVSVISCRLTTKKCIRDIDIFFENKKLSFGSFYPFTRDPILIPMIRKILENWEMDD